MNASQLMDKQVKDLSSIGSDNNPSRDELFLNLVKSHLPVHLNEAIAADEAHGSEEAANRHSSDLHESSVYSADEVEEEIVPSYDFHPIRPLESRASISRVWPSGDSKSTIFPQNYKSPDLVETNQGKREALNMRDLLSEIDRLMKAYVGEILHSLEGASARLTQVETRIRTLESSVDDVKVALETNNGITDRKIGQVENILYKIQSVVCCIKDEMEAKAHKEMPETPKHTFDSQTLQTSSHHFQLSSLPKTSDPFPPPDTYHHPPSDTRHHPSPDTYHPPPSVTLQPPYLPPPQQLPPAMPQDPPQQPHLPPLPPQQPHLPPLPPQQPHLPSLPPHQPYLPLVPPQQPHLPSLALQQSQQPRLPSVPPQQPNLSSMPPQHQNLSPIHQQPHLSSMGQQPHISPMTQQPHLPQMPPPAVPQQPYPTVYPPHSPPNAQSYYGVSNVYDPPAGLYTGGYGGFASDNYGNAEAKPAQLPTARLLPQAVPTASRVEGSGQSGSSSKFPIDDVIDRVSSMGFSREQVQATVQKLTENGQSVELNVVLDKLMNDGEMQNRRGAWFG